MGASATIVGTWFAGGAVTAAGVATVAGAVAEAGAVMAVAGAVTGNKNLSQIGGDLAIAGGVTGLGASAFDALSASTVADTTANTVAGSTAPAATTATATDASGIANGLAMPAGGAAADSAIPGTVDPSIASMTNAATAPSSGSLADLTANPASTLATPPTGVSLTPGVSPAGIPTTGTPYDPNSPLASYPTTYTPSAADSSSQVNQLLDQGSKQADTASWFSSLDAPTKAMVVTGLTQAGGAALGGLSNAYTTQQKMALAQLQNSQEYQKYLTAMGNLNSAPQSQFTGMPISSPQTNLLTGKPSTGLIGTATGA